MNVFFHKVLINIVLLTLSALLSTGFAADKKPYSTSPPAQVTKKWRIGYYEGGPYQTFPVTLIAIVNNLSELGWLEPVTIPPQEDEKDASKLWAWLAANVKSKYIEFVPDAFYSYNWKKELREPTKQTVIKRLKEAKDINMMIGMGTFSGQDLANNDHSVPIVVAEVSDAIASKIIPSAEDSGYDHVHVMIDPKRHTRQIYSFHDIIGFKKLGVAYVNTPGARTYAAIEHLQRIAKERNFELVECHIPEGGATPENNAKIIECAKTLAPKIDALYLTMAAVVNKETLPQIISAMNAAKIPVFSQFGSDEVRQGALLSIATSTNLKAYAKFHADVIAKIINGAKPRDLDQVCEAPPKIAFNKAAAKAIDLKDDMYQLLSKTAQEVYDKIETGK
jgi:ABC-type uncharacterized transport system substrate-binding protein